MLGGLPIAVIDRARSADLMIDVAQRRRGTGQCPLIFTSANGHVLSICGSRPEVRELYLAADLIHADGMPLVFSSRLFHKTPLPERVATTDLFHDVARLTQRTSPRIFLLGGTYSAAHQATKCARALYPGINIVGSSGGYLRRRGDEDRIIDAINNAGPDILWLGLGAPAELSFAMRHRDKLRNVGLIKTSGGLFDFLSGKNARAPSWMQTAGLEWCYRLYLEPRRLGGRYLLTNPHALLLLLTQTGQVDRPVQSSNER
jgi:exopolysaccharide biosynthesis WecB/TagA/CpsF family protein